MEKLISVVVPIYQVEPYIGKSIASICRQTFEEFEVILVDDGSTDRSTEIAASLLDSAHISYCIVRQSNKGLGRARNAGLSLGKKWVIFLDSDDMLQPYALQRLYDVANKCDADFVFSGYQKVQIGDEYKGAKDRVSWVLYDRETIQELFLKRKVVILAPGTLYKTSWLARNNLFFSSIPYSEDQLFIWELLLSVKKVAYLQSDLYNYLSRPGSIMRATNAKNIALSYRSFEHEQEKYKSQRANNFLVRKYLLPRWVLGVIHSSAKNNSIGSYKWLMGEIGAKRHCQVLLNFPEWKVRLSAFSFLFSWKFYYYLVRLIGL